MEKGDYYRVHLDGWQGKLNTIYYLNTDWKWDWGGLLHVVKDNDGFTRILGNKQKLNVNLI